MARVILRLPAVKAGSGLSRSTLYARMKDGLWTRPVHLGPRAVGWPSDEVAAINAARIAGKDDAAIRALVVRLEAARKAPLSDPEVAGMAIALQAGWANLATPEGNKARGALPDIDAVERWLAQVERKG